VLYALVYAQLGTGLGIPYLFWHEDFATRVSAALGATLLLGVVGVNAYYLDPYPFATDQKTRAWLAVDEYLRGSVAAWWSRVPTPPITRAERAVERLVALVRSEPSTPRQPRAVRPAPAELARPPRRLDRLIFGLNAIVDPISVSPIQAWLDPPPPGTGSGRGWGNEVRLSRRPRATGGAGPPASASGGESAARRSDPVMQTWDHLAFRPVPRVRAI
jgi:hypothetical protein